MPKPAKQKKKVAVPYVLLQPGPADKGREPYRMVEAIIKECHDELVKSKPNIAIVWLFNAKADADGRVKLGGIKIPTKADAAIITGKTDHVDAMIWLNHDTWNMADTTQEMRRYILDDCLEQLRPRIDKQGEVSIDEDGHTVYRKRPHRVELFPEVLARNGCQLEDLQHLATIFASRQERDRPLFENLDKEEEDDKPADVLSMENQLNGGSVSSGRKAAN